MAPTSASEIAIFMPEKRCGSALGMRSNSNVCRLPPRIERKRSTASGSTERSPRTVSTTIAKSAMRKEIATLEERPVPIQMMKSGASATFGTLFSATSSV
jgi:hypothetical protein